MTDLCRQVDAMIARSPQLTTEEAAKLEAHLAGCRECRELARVMRSVDDAALAATGTSETVLSNATTSAGHDRDRDHGLTADTTDRYRVTGEVGRGGIGRVWQARDQVLDRPVALKELLSANGGMRRRFIREALITARLQHPSIVPVYDAGRLGDRSPFYAMKLVAGRPLDKAIEEATTLAQRLALLPNVLAIADATAYAHSERVIHRDLKPANILVGKFGETFVIDWGLAKDLAVDDGDALEVGPYRSESLDQTVAGTMLGTPAYMAPEQAAGEVVDERADVYALGAILYHLVTGTGPHQGTTLEEMVGRVVTGDVRPLTDREPGAPRDLAAIVSKAMALEPSARYPNAQGLADDLRRFLTGQLVASHTYGTRELVRRWLKRHRGAVTVALAALLVVGVVGIVSITRIVHARHQADEAAALATEQRNSATETLADMLAEQGRAELVAGRPARAAVYLSEAHARSREPGAALRSLLAGAMRSVDTQGISLDGHTRELDYAAFSRDGTRIVTTGMDRMAQVWDARTGKVAATLRGHTREVVTASFSSDGARIVTASRDRTAKIWDARTGAVVATFDHPGELLSAAFSPDGARIVTTTKEGAVKLWDATTAQPLVSFDGHGTRVHATAFSADGTRVATAGADHTAKVWDATTGALLLSLEGHRSDVHQTAFSPDGLQIITASDDGTARLWDARTGAVQASLEGHTGPVVHAAYSPDGTRVVTGSDDDTAKLWNAQTGRLLTTLGGHAAELHAAAFSPDGSRIVTASHDRTARLWDAQTGTLLAAFEGHRDDVLSASFAPDGTQVVTASSDGTVKLWDARPSHRRVPLGGSIGGARFGRDGAIVATFAERDHVSKLWDTRSGKLLASLDHGGKLLSVDVDAAGTRVVTASDDHTAKIWDATTGKLVVSLAHPDSVRVARFSPDGARVVTAGADQGARIWNATTGALIARLERIAAPDMSYPDYAISATFSKDGGRVVIASTDRTARIWRTDNGKPIAQLVGHTGTVYAGFLSDDGRRVVTASQDSTAKVWDAETGTLVASLDGHTSAVFLARFSPDGARVVTASGDRSAKLWDARTGKLLASLDGHTADVVAAVFSPDVDGARVMTASDDRTARLWDARTGKLLATLDGRTGALVNSIFSLDASTVTTLSRDGTIWQWDVHLEQRTPDAIQRIIAARVPWTLSNGGLVPVPPEVRTESDAGAPGGMSSNEYLTKVTALIQRQADLFKEPDCDKLAAALSAFADATKDQFAALEAWRNDHILDEAALEKVTAPVTREFQNITAVIARCKDNQAFAAALAKTKLR